MSQPTPPPDEQQPYAQQPPAQEPYAQQPYAPQGYGYGGPQYAMAPSRPNNTMAVISLISGIVGLTVIPIIGSIVAVITGHMARREIARTGEEGSGLATGGLIMGYIGVGLLVVGGLIAILVFGVFAVTVGSAGSYS